MFKRFKEEAASRAFIGFALLAARLAELLGYYHFVLKKNAPARSCKTRPPRVDPQPRLQKLSPRARLRTRSRTAKVEEFCVSAVFTSLALLPSRSGALRELRQIAALGRAAVNFERRLSASGVAAERRVTD